MKRLIIFLASVTFVFGLSALLVAYGQGYRFNFSEKRISGTGILTISSEPEGAEVYINDELRGGTDTSIPNLAPGKYSVRLEKNGFNSWEKEVEIEQEKVTPLEVSLFPSAPDLSALTFSGVVSPKISPDGTKIAYAITDKSKAGIWVLQLGNRQLFFSNSPQQIAKDNSNINFSEASFEWSSDSASLLVSGKLKSGKNINYLLDSGSLNEDFSDVSSRVKNLKDQWLDDQKVREENALENLGEDAQLLAKGADDILFSADEKRVLIVRSKGKTIVYDSEPSLVPGAKAARFEIPKALYYIWYPTNRHIVLVNEESISIIEADGQNNETIFTGSFAKEAVFFWPDGSKLIIATTLNTANSMLPNLYSVRLR